MIRHLSMIAILVSALVTAAVIATTNQSHAQSLNDLTKGLSKLGLGGGGDNKSGGGAPANLEAGLIEALVVGSKRVIDQLGVKDGFNADPSAHIPLPGAFKKAQSALKLAGLSGMADDLELRLNRAAEQATPIAKDLILDAVRGLTFKDAAGIFNGPDDAATQYLKGATGSDIAAQMKPIVDEALQDTGAIKAFDTLMGDYKNLPFVPDINADLTNHVLDYAQKGIFGYLAQEEAAIRSNPAARSTELLQQVFGG